MSQELLFTRVGIPHRLFWSQCILDNYGDIRDFYGVINSFKHYRLTLRTTLLPEGYGVFLLERRPSVVSDEGAEIPAASYSRSNLLTSPVFIGAEDVPQHGFWEPDYDLFFPYWLDYPLVGKNLRQGGDPYFCEYDLEFAQGGSFDLYGQFGVTRECSISVYCDGKALVRELKLYPDGDTGRVDYVWRSMGTMTLAPGTHRIRFEGKDDFPHFRALKFSKL
ncbi:MAG: hypothetical protein P8123_03110 [bacterium]